MMEADDVETLGLVSDMFEPAGFFIAAELD